MEDPELNLAREVPLNSYGIIVPDYKLKAYTCLVGLGTRRPFYIGITDGKERVGVLAHLDLFTLRSSPTIVFIHRLASQLEKLQAKNCTVQTINLRVNEVRSYVMHGKEITFPVSGDREVLLKMLVGLLTSYEGLMPQDKREEDLGFANYCTLTLAHGLLLHPVLGDLKQYLQSQGYSGIKRTPEVGDIRTPTYRHFGSIHPVLGKW